MINKTAEQLFANEKAVFAFNGSWCVNVYKGMNPNIEYGAFLPPRVSNEHPMSVWGGAGSSFMVNARSPVKDEAVKFLRWLTETKQQGLLPFSASRGCDPGGDPRCIPSLTAWSLTHITFLVYYSST